MSTVLKEVNRVKQTEQANSRQVQNNAGGFVYGLDIWKRLERFLILGVDSNTYYQSNRELARENMNVVLDAGQEDYRRALDTIVNVSKGGRASKNSPALFALAVLGANVQHPGEVYARLPEVARTATHLFEFLDYSQEFRGWGRSLQEGVAAWYTGKEKERLAYQLVKYRQRNGWTHRDVLRKAHPRSAELNDLFAFAVNGTEADSAIVQDYLAVQKAGTAKEVVNILSRGNLPWEAIPTEFHTDKNVWTTLLDNEALPIGALIRQLPRFSNLGVFEDAKYRNAIAERLKDVDVLKAGRVHPVQMITAYMTYKSGRGTKNTWSPSVRIMDALHDGFYASFAAVEPTNKSILLALDVSGSMTMGTVANSPLTPREASAVMAMVTARSEPDYEVVGFTGSLGWAYSNEPELTRLRISKNQSLETVVKTISGLPFGRTDCAAPMVWAKQNNKKFDAFCIYTDSETWSGNVHPDKALRDYRKIVPDAKLCVVGMTATDFSIADPQDPGMLDVVGFDSNAPAIMADFIR